MCEDYFEDDYFDEDITYEEDHILDRDDDMINDCSENDTPHDEFTMEEAFFLGAMMGFAYEEGLDKKRKREIKRENLELDDIFDLDEKK